MILTTFILFLTKSVACNAYAAASYEALERGTCQENIVQEDVECTDSATATLATLWAQCEATLPELAP